MKRALICFIEVSCFLIMITLIIVFYPWLFVSNNAALIIAVIFCCGLVCLNIWDGYREGLRREIQLKKRTERLFAWIDLMGIRTLVVFFAVWEAINTIASLNGSVILIADMSLVCSMIHFGVGTFIKHIGDYSLKSIFIQVDDEIDGQYDN